MSRDIFINGETMVSVKGRTDSAISALTQLGLAESGIRVTINDHHDDIHVDTFGPSVPIDEQYFLTDAIVDMTLIHFDRSVIDECVRLSMAGAAAIGQLPRAGVRMGGGLARFAAGNNYIGLNLSSPVGNKPWRFYFAYLAQRPFVTELGTKRSMAQLTWRAIPYTQDPWNGGVGSQGTIIWDHINDT